MHFAGTVHRFPHDIRQKQAAWIISSPGKWFCMEMPGLRTWVVFYLISFVVLLWAAFLSAQGVMLWVSLLLVLIIIGLNIMTVMNQLKVHAARKELQQSLTRDFVRGEAQEKDDQPPH